MNVRLCGIFLPLDDTHEYFSDIVNETSSCLRMYGHEGQHISRKHDGTYVVFNSTCDQDYLLKGNSDWDVLFWEIETIDAEHILSVEKPMN